MSAPLEKSFDEAPVYLSAEEAQAWASGYNAALEDVALWLKEETKP